MEYRDLFEENKRLKEEILKLREEISNLKSFLGKSTISSSNKLKQAITSKVINKSNDTKNVSKFSTMEDKIELYRSLFKGREDVFALRWESKDRKKTGYSPYCSNEWKIGICDKRNIRCEQCKNRNLKPLDNLDIINHLNGIKTVGIYPMLKGDLCNFFAIDFDDGNWKNDVKAVYKSFKEFDLYPSIEVSRSGEGAHLWIFFEEPISASKARYLGDLLMKYTMQNNFGIALDSYDRYFPNQDKMPKGNFGNLIALPLQRIPAKEGNSLFVDEDFNYYTDQWIYLSNVKKNKIAHITEVVLSLESYTNNVEISTILDEGQNIYSTKCESKIQKLIDYKGSVRITLSNGISINTEQLSLELLNEIKKLAVFSNPEFYKRQALRLYLGKTPRSIKGFDEKNKVLIMPRGCFRDIICLLEKCKVEYELKEERNTGENINVEFKGSLYESQLKAYNEILEQDNCILHASTAFGKTIVALNVIAARKVSTLIIVNSIELLEQWKAKIEMFLDLGDKKVGKLGAGRKRTSKFIDVATIQTLNKASNLEEILDSYGQVVIDECHHLAAFTFEKVLKQCRARYILGLTATIKRKDGLESIVEFQCGKLVHGNINRNFTNNKLAYVLIPRRVTLKTEYSKDGNLKISDFYNFIEKDYNRNNFIFNDVMDALREGRNPIVLTERLEHLEYLEKIFTKAFERVIVLRGGMGKKQRQKAIDNLMNIKDGENFLIISTGKYIGEGFDDVRLDTLFLTMPISWEGTLKQYAGRLHRMNNNKEVVKIYDYIDENVPQLMRMYKKRQKGYKSMGYELENNAGIQYELNL